MVWFDRSGMYPEPAEITPGYGSGAGASADTGGPAPVQPPYPYSEISENTVRTWYAQICYPLWKKALTFEELDMMVADSWLSIQSQFPEMTRDELFMISDIRDYYKEQAMIYQDTGVDPLAPKAPSAAGGAPWPTWAKVLLGVAAVATGGAVIHRMITGRWIWAAEYGMRRLPAPVAAPAE